ncbi:MAG: hypothetical protein ACPG5B_10190 [Chitinophagales bacterium]
MKTIILSSLIIFALFTNTKEGFAQDKVNEEEKIVLQEQELLDGKVKIGTPENWRYLSPRIKRMTFPQYRQADVVSMIDASAYLVAQHSIEPLENGDVAVLNEQIKKNLATEFEDIVYLKNDVANINEQKISYYECLVEEKSSYILQFYTNVEGCMLEVRIKAKVKKKSEEEIKAFRKLASQMMESLIIVN